MQGVIGQNSLSAVKEDELIIRGYRNKEDLLWDIPVTNPDLLKTKNKTRINNAGVYAYSNKKKDKPINRGIKSKEIPQYENIFESFKDIIDYNDCVNAINEQS